MIDVLLIYVIAAAASVIRLSSGFTGDQISNSDSNLTDKSKCSILSSEGIFFITSYFLSNSLSGLRSEPESSLVSQSTTRNQSVAKQFSQPENILLR